MSEPTKREIAFPLSKDSEGNTRILRLRGNGHGSTEVAMGIVLPIKNGQPIIPGCEILRLSPSEDGGHLDIETVYSSCLSGGEKGWHKMVGGWRPMAVSHDTFAESWVTTFGKKADKVDQTVN